MSSAAWHLLPHWGRRRARDRARCVGAWLRLLDAAAAGQLLLTPCAANGALLPAALAPCRRPGRHDDDAQPTRRTRSPTTRTSMGAVGCCIPGSLASHHGRCPGGESLRTRTTRAGCSRAVVGRCSRHLLLERREQPNSSDHLIVRPEGPARGGSQPCSEPTVERPDQRADMI